MLESVDSNELFERDNPFSHFLGSCNKRSNECVAILTLFLYHNSF